MKVNCQNVTYIVIFIRFNYLHCYLLFNQSVFSRYKDFCLLLKFCKDFNVVIYCFNFNYFIFPIFNIFKFRIIL